MLTKLRKAIAEPVVIPAGVIYIFAFIILIGKVLEHNWAFFIIVFFAFLGLYLIDLYKRRLHEHRDS